MDFAWILAHAGELIAIVTGTVTVASLIAALTPTPADDAAISWLRKLIDVLALNVFNAKK